MTAPTLAALALGAMIPEAHPLDREAGGVHQPLDWYAENGIEPAIETADLCASVGPWYCTDTDMLRARVGSSVIPRCDPKSCLLDETWALLTGDSHAPFYTTATPSGSGSRQSAPQLWGGVAGGTASASAASESRSEATATARVDSDCGCPDPNPDPDPDLTPIPAPASLPLLVGALALLLRRLR